MTIRTAPIRATFINHSFLITNTNAAEEINVTACINSRNCVLNTFSDKGDAVHHVAKVTTQA